MTLSQILTKINKTINSCLTLSQLDFAENYCYKLADKYAESITCCRDLRVKSDIYQFIYSKLNGKRQCL